MFFREEELVMKGLKAYKITYNTAVTKLKIELNNPTFHIVSSYADRKLGQIVIKWTISGQSKMNATISKMINVG